MVFIAVRACSISVTGRFGLQCRRGFTLIELMVVLAIVALGTALVSLALPDGDRNVLARDGARLAALLESARAQSRVAGVPVQWRPTAGGFVFDGLPATAPPLPSGWLDARTRAVGNAPVTLGPDPIIPAQAIVLQLTGSATPPLRVATDGLRPFDVEDVPP